MANQLFDFMSITKALTDENRVRILMALRERELCVCQVTGFLDLSPSTTSKHLSILRQARLIESRKKGKWVYYSIPDLAKTHSAVTNALEWVLSSLGTSNAIIEDEKRIQEILKQEATLYESESKQQADHYHSLEIHSLASPEEENI